MYRIGTTLILLLTTTLLSAVKKGPYLLYEGSNTEMTILWQLSDKVESTVSWGKTESLELGTGNGVEYGSDNQYQFTIQDLTPGELYHYSVSGVGSGTFRAAPAEGASKVKLFGYGDTRSNANAHNSVCQGMVNRYTEDSSLNTAVLFSGDYVSQGGSESDWSNQYFSRKAGIMKLQSDLPVVGAIGNHEGERTGGTELLKKYYPFPHVTEKGFYWSTDYGPVHVIYVDQFTTSYAPGSEQYNWLKSDLASTNKEWIVILLHSPGYSAGGGHSNEKDVQNYIQPLAEQYGVDMIITGDNHYYARAEVNGVQHITTGGGGAPLYSPDTSFPYIVKTDKSYHFCEFDFDGKNCTITARRANGEVIETFTLSHEGSKTPTVIITNPTRDTTIGIDEIVTLKAAVNAYGDEITSVELLVDGSVYDETSSEPYEFDFSFNSVDTKEIVICATINGNKYSSDPISISIVDIYDHEFTISAKVTKSSDDAEEYLSDGTVDIKSSDLEFVNDPQFGEQLVGIRFENITIPENAVLTGAWMQFTADEKGSGTDTFIIAGEHAVESETFSDVENNISKRTKTDTEVSWSPANWATIDVSTTIQKTPNLQTIVEEVTSIPGWNGTLSFIVSSTSTRGVRVAESFDGDNQAAPTLTVSYTLDQSTAIIRQPLATYETAVSVFPNPIRSGEQARFYLNSDNIQRLEQIEITIVSYLGVPLFYSGRINADALSNIAWNGTNMSGKGVGAGSYLALVTLWNRDGTKRRLKVPIGVQR